MEQWNERAAATYRQCLTAVEVESSRLGLDYWQFHTGHHPRLDAAYRAALDALDAADDEGSSAARAKQLEGSFQRPADLGQHAAAHIVARVVERVTSGR